MDKSAQLARHADAIEQGYNSVLSGGKSALNPADLAAQLASAGPETLGGLQIGTRAAIDNSLGTKAIDEYPGAARWKCANGPIGREYECLGGGSNCRA
jgi:hypothetical protein